MYSQVEKQKENKSRSVANSTSWKKSASGPASQFVDSWSEAVAQRELREMADNSLQAMQLKAFQGAANNDPQTQQAAQLQAMVNNFSNQQQPPLQRKNSNTGFPDNLKAGIENLSDYSMDDVTVHRNADKPAQLQAYAYAQGTDIHLGPGQEKRLMNNRPQVAAKSRLQDMAKNNTKVNKLESFVQNPSPIQRVTNISAGKGGICGPSVLSGIVSKLGGEARTVEYIKDLTIEKTSSALGEIFTWADMKKVADALGIDAVKREFNSAETLLQALEATGGNPVLAAISNVGFPGKENQAYDQKLIGKEWVRAHWIAITAFNKEDKKITYKDNGDDGGTAALFSQLVANNQIIGNSWDWDVWGQKSGGSVPEAKKGKEEKLDLSGYIVEFKKLEKAEGGAV